MSVGSKPDVGYKPTMITVELVIKNHKVDERVSYANHETAHDRKKVLQQIIKDKKKERGKGDGKGPDHSEDLTHNSWVTKPKDTVVFRCENSFKLRVDYDRHVCPPVAGAPHNPFGWDEDGYQQAKLGGVGYEVRGIAVDDDPLVLEQMFYKFTAVIDGITEPFDPDGICGSTGN
jgi:hypothetical protein